MDYTKDRELMRLLSKLSLEIEGYNYSLNKSADEKVMSYRTEKVNDAVEEVKNHLTKSV
ncbi:MAG: hypothetical protein K0Q73_7543 [Paenibacillus sp.]|jgi:hypothetical protein|nr:hypothetical protein [Paenibacillus sp.]